VSALPQPFEKAVDTAVRAALAEDVGSGDLTTRSVISPELRARATMVSREACVVAGLPVAKHVFELLDPSTIVLSSADEGADIEPGQVVLTLEASAAAILTGERTALNFVQRLSGVATATRRHTSRVDGHVAVLDTRKTTPGLRALERYAVAVGGGTNHRFGLFDQVLLKENHFELAGGAYRATVERARAAVGPHITLGAEARSYEEACAAIDAGADYVLLDNFSAEALKQEVPRLRERIAASGRTVELEASGGIRESNIAEFAASGVDRISCGGLTHSARAIDFALDVRALSSARGDRGASAATGSSAPWEVRG